MLRIHRATTRHKATREATTDTSWLLAEVTAAKDRRELATSTVQVLVGQRPKKRRTFKPAPSLGKGSSETRSSRSASPKPITPPCGNSSWTQIGKGKYKCLCGTPFTRLADLHRHQKPDPRTCPICGAILSRKDALRRHLAVKHSLSDAIV